MFPSTGAKSKPILDEAGFQQLLAAAYVLQQHNDSVRLKDARLDPAWIFSQIAETQSLVRASALNFATAITVIADRLRKITGASGISICVLADGCLECAAESGISVTVPGGSVAANSEAATERLKNGKHFQSSDAQKDIRLDTALCQEYAVRALLTMPIQRSGEILGLLELRAGKTDAFHECDVRTCDLMAGFLAELLQREIESDLGLDGDRPSLDKAMSSDEPSGNALTPRSALDQLSPDDLFASEDASDDGPAPDSKSDSPDVPAASESSDLASSCRVCGRPFGMDEAFCGNCSMPRIAASPAEGLQSKWASMWFMQQAHDTVPEHEGAEPQHADRSKQAFEKEFSAPSAGEKFQAFARPKSIDVRPDFRHYSHPENADSVNIPATQRIGHDFHWTAHESGGETGRDVDATNPEGGRWSFGNVSRSAMEFVRASRRNKAVAIAAVFVFLLVSAWGLRPSYPAPPGQLNWFESVLVDMGLAEAPGRAPAFAGNPSVQVWVDVHTALYYCQGSALYGKSPGGYFATQRDAQQDQFHSAMRQPCE